ncbi:MAG: ArsR/SmtB family transcription factor [Eubacteriaceae bacterium]
MKDNILNEEYEKKSELLKIIGHPIRLCILYNLYKQGSKNVTTMQDCLDIPQSTVSQHLAKLKSVGVIKGNKNGTEIKYELIDELVVEILDVLFNNK